MTVTYSVVVELENADETGVIVYVPALPGCVTDGDSEELAMENLRDAVAGWIVAWRRHNPDKRWPEEKQSDLDALPSATKLRKVTFDLD